MKKALIGLMIALCVSFLALSQFEVFSQHGDGTGGRPMTKEEQAAYQEHMNAAKQLASEGKTDEAMKAIDNALRCKPNDPAALALQAKIAPQVKGMAFTTKNPQGYLEYRHKRTGITFVLIPGGKFLMGCKPGPGGGEGEIDNPPHEVSLSDFLMSKTEVPQGAWRKIMKERKDKTDDSPSFFKAEDDFPVEQVSWEDCQKFIEWSKDIRLPTEAEWEYACRAETSTNFYWGDDEDVEYMWYTKNSGAKSQATSTRKLNSYGLYDMSGNVFEWCSDWYDAKYYYNSPKENPQGPKTGKLKVMRGGSWKSPAYPCRSDVRSKIEPNTKSSEIGFRCASDVK
ncbi:MAG: SUMF1/EgtB/PvdO family nonheme iron enzyme [Planctomycetes bacterium]|nr:SUMF1/EgtB/PvdO family nonheme iron enzyme [Planctomycetota bacterium]